MIDQLNKEEKSIPLFVKYADSFIDIIPSHSENVEIHESSKLVYMGRKVLFQKPVVQ